MTRRKRLWTIILSSIAAVLVIVGLVLTYYARQMEPMARDWIVQYLSEKFDSDVELKELRVSAIPRLHVTGKGVLLHWKHRSDVPPMIRLGEFSFQVKWGDLAAPTKHISLIKLKDLELNLPPRNDQAKSPDQDQQEAKKDSGGGGVSVVVDEIVADKTLLRMLPREKEKAPKEFELHELRLYGAGAGQPMSYVTRMTNFKPPGMIDSKGQFGPWNTHDPGGSPLAGVYDFQKADLGVFKGIEGILTSTGKFSGQLNHINVVGEANVPDFRLKMAGNPVPLRTKFVALVDGTNGNTSLKPVEAMLGETPMLIQGDIIGEKNIKGKNITLDAVINNGRMEDVLRLAVKGKNPMTGAITLKAQIDLPRGDVDVIQKLGLRGDLLIHGMQFTNKEIQSKIDELSRRGQGAPGHAEIARVRSRIDGNFTLADTVIRFQKLKYGVEGAEVDLHGHYGIKSEDIDFAGVLRLDAKASQTFKGMKSVMLRPFDGLVSRGNRGTILSIKVEGTRNHPKFGLDMGRTIKKKDN